MSAAPAAAGVPAGWCLGAAHSTRLRDGVLFGGTPRRVLRLSPAGLELVRGWMADAPVGEPSAERALARRLLDAGLFHPLPPASAVGEPLTVVVPVRDQAEALARCLAALPDDVEIIVVDDGSRDRQAVTAVCEQGGAARLRLPRSGGPAAARNLGLAAVRTPLVAFLDADCVVSARTLERLAAHLVDPALAAVAPRIVSLGAAPGRLAAHERHHAALDMGARPSLVAPGRPVGYVPSAALVARVAVLGRGFDEALRLGEDVDLIWRLHREGHPVRYDPTLSVAHEHRVAPRSWFARRVAYDTAGAPLAVRHPDRVTALEISGAGALTWAGLLAGRPAVVVAAAAVAVHRLRGRLAPSVRGATPLALGWVVTDRIHDGQRLAAALSGPWLLPTLLAGVRFPRLGRRAAALVLADVTLTWARERHEPTPLHLLGPFLAGGLARCLGLWAGCVRHRTARPLAVRWAAPPSWLPPTRVRPPGGVRASVGAVHDRGRS